MSARHGLPVQDAPLTAVSLAVDLAIAQDELRGLRQNAERLNSHRDLMVRATELLAITLDVDEALVRLARLLVPLLADWVVISLADDNGQLTSRSFVHHRDGHADLIARFQELVPAAVSPLSPMYTLLKGEPASFRARYEPPVIAAMSPQNQELRELSAALGLGSVAFVPLMARQRVVGTLMLVHGPSGRAYTQEELDVAVDLGRRAGLAVDNARMYTLQHTNALILQDVLVPKLPAVKGLSLAAEYLPAGRHSHIGGDWWDAFTLPDGAVALAIGDVMGHDLRSAASMGQLRSVLRSCAWTGSHPEPVLARLDELAQAFDMTQFATCFYARFEPADSAVAGREVPRLHWSNAGHLPPIALDPSGHARLLSTATGAPIGTPVTDPRGRDSIACPSGTTLLLYTDGLVETRGGDIEQDVADLLEQVGRHRPQDGPQALIDALLDGRTAWDDDVALLAVQVH